MIAARTTFALTTALLLSAAQTSEASDLSFAFTALRTANHTFTPHAAARRSVPTPAALAAEAVEPKLLLGAYLNGIEGGLQVTGTVPGSPASQSLRSGDVIRSIAVMGQPTRKLETVNQLEYAKRAIGPNRQVLLEVIRPGIGVTHLPVTFRPADEFALATR